MATYKFDWLNGSEAIVNPTIIKEGFAGGTFINDVSQGEFCVNIVLENSGGRWGVELVSNSLPTGFTTEEIDTWVSETLQQYEI